VEDFPAYVILGTRDKEAGWGKTAGKLAELVVELDQQDNAVITEGIVEDVLELVILGTGHKDAGWGETARKLAEDVEQGDYVITLDLVEDVLVTVILGTGDKDAGCGETAEKLAEILEPDLQDNAEIETGIVEDFVDGVILGYGEAIWAGSARKLAENVDPLTSKMHTKFIKIDSFQKLIFLPPLLHITVVSKKQHF